jgi:hypothetical protein
MRWSLTLPAVRRRAVMGGALAGALACGVAIGMALMVARADAQVARREFKAGTGMVLNYVRTDKTADFEAIMQKLKEALAKNEKRRDQGKGWKVYKAQEAGPNNTALYVWFIDPTLSGADYTVSMILNETFPAEVQKLYEQFNSAFAGGGGQSMVNLQLVNDFGN